VSLRMGVVAFALLCFTATSQAQAPTAVVNGQVRDSSGAAIPNATVEIVNDATHVRYTTETNSEGIYSVPNLPPGTYHIQVSKTGFKTIIHPDVVLHVQDADAIGFTLPVGATSDTVTVEGGAPLVNTESAAVSTVIDRQFVESLPLNGRSFNTLLQLTPGVVIAQQPSSDSAGQFSIAGQRTSANNFSVDGVSANFGVQANLIPGASGLGGAQAFSALGGTSSLVSVEALEEFRIETSSSAPEFGRAPGGQVLLTTRAGTNAFHGGIFNYFRNTAMDANDWFANQTSQPRAPEHHNDFGGFLGGPIWKDKTFFFLSYEGARLDLPQTTPTQVPSQFARAQAPAALAPFLNAYPLPNGQPASSTAYTAPFTGNYSNAATLDAGSVRIDHRFGDRFSIFGRYNDAPSEIANRVGSLSMVLTSVVNTQTLTIGLNMLLSSRLSNTLRGNYSTQNSNSFYTLDSFGGAVPVNSSLLLGSLAPASNLGSFQTFQTFAYSIGPQARNRTRQFNLVDDLAVTFGTHQVKLGGDYRAIFLDANPYQNQAIYVAPSVQGFVSPGPGQGQVFLLAFSFAPTQFLAQSLSFFAQDTWKVRRRLTLTYGLRWELSPPPSARGTTTLASWMNVNDPANITLAPPGTPLWNTTHGNFAPRLGVAYRLTESGNFVLRVGGGVFYDLGLGESANLGGSFPNSASRFSFGVTAPVSDLTPFLPTLSTQPPFPTVNAFSPNLTLPRSYQWNLSLERSFGGKRALTASYVGQAGRDLLRQEAQNRPNSNFRAGSVFQLTGNDAWSNLDALQLQYRQTLSSRLRALFNYTWSHSLDNSSNDVVVGLSNTVISAARDYASSGFDVRHNFSGALTLEIPGAGSSQLLSHLTKDWSVDAVIIARTGFPFNAFTQVASPVGGGTQVRPDRVPGQPVWINSPNAPGGKMLNVTFDPTTGAIIGGAFAIPSAPRQGTEGRNDIPGFGLTEVDLSLGRKFAFTERLHLQFRADAFNVFNHPNFANPLANLDAGTADLVSAQMLNRGLGGLSSLFQQGGPRSMQLSLRLLF
jgi:hypothetical protein